MAPLFLSVSKHHVAHMSTVRLVHLTLPGRDEPSVVVCFQFVRRFVTPWSLAVLDTRRASWGSEDLACGPQDLEYLAFLVDSKEV